jgi:hypothetical protein
MLGYLETTHLLDAAGFAALVADQVTTLTGDPAFVDELAVGRGLDDREALQAMRVLLARLQGPASHSRR